MWRGVEEGDGEFESTNLFTENEGCPNEKFVTIGSTGSCLDDNLWCHQWRQSWQHDASQFSVRCIEQGGNKFESILIWLLYCVYPPNHRPSYHVWTQTTLRFANCIYLPVRKISVTSSGFPRLCITYCALAMPHGDKDLDPNSILIQIYVAIENWLR